MRMNPYLSFDGTCREAFEFYAKVLDGKIEMVMTYADAPAGSQVPPGGGDRIMHARLRFGDQLLMGSDAPPQFREEPKGFSVSLQIDDPAEAERVFQALAERGQVKMPIGETFWAQRFGMLVDRFAIPWMVNCEKPA